jgi:UV DNA damage endonuclease
VGIRLGYVSTSLTLGISASHTCRLANATPRRLAELTALNLAELEQLLLFNETHGIGLFRIGSSLVPLASHPINRLQWWRTFRRDFERLGAIAARSGQRLSMHPSPAAASLSSARASVREAALAELRYSALVLDLLGQGPSSRVVLHVGGAAPDRPTALASAARFLDEMPRELRHRLALENDDRIWSAAEVYPLAVDHGLPMVADTLHNAVHPSQPELPIERLLELGALSWRRLGLRPKVHLASQRPGAIRGAHADFIDPADWSRLSSAVGEAFFDVMLEAKQKDRALFALRALGAECEQMAEAPR